MAYSDDTFCDAFSEKSNSSSFESTYDEEEDFELCDYSQNTNIALHVINRQIYGRFTKHNRAKTEKVFRKIHPQCKFPLSSLIKCTENLNHVFMGFTICSTYFLSFTENGVATEQDILYMLNTKYEYELHLWKFQPGTELKYLTKYRIFKQVQDSSNVLDNVMFMQFPLDPHKIICYGVVSSNSPMAYMTILTLPSKSCRHCSKSSAYKSEEISGGWCSKHGFILHYTFPLSNPFPVFDPHISLAYPDYIVINTGHYIHILNITTLNPLQNNVQSHMKYEEKIGMNFNDTQSEASETVSDHFDSNSVVDAILEDFNEYDLEGSECNKPFHELNISCEPLNVTGKSYHNTLVQNIVDPRMKRLQTKDYQFPVPHSSSLQKNAEKMKIDLKIAEKAYEFIEENEKCEKLSSFRKRRLAEKKYEFSEDNTENIVPFNSLRRERRFFRRCIRSPELNSLFLSPRSPGIRSPMQSPSSRNGQFSPSGARNVYCTSFRNSPHHSNRSPISPKDTARKFHVYSPCNLDNDSDCDSKLIIRSTITNLSSYNSVGGCSNDNGRANSSGLLIVDPAGRDNKPKWIKKVVRRYSNGDFENGSLLSGQSRDDYNIPIEIPLIAQTLSDQILDIVPGYKAEHITQMQLIVTQRSFDSEQFIQRQAQQLCTESQLQFLHCQDYDIKILHICPIEGLMICKANIKIGALKNSCKPAIYCTEFIFTWNIVTDEFNVLISSIEKLCLVKDFKPMPTIKIPRVNRQNILVLDYRFMTSKTMLRDYAGNYEIRFTEDVSPFSRGHSNDLPSDLYFLHGISSDFE